MQNPNEYADIFVIRTKTIVGGGVGVGVTFDGFKMVSMTPGHYIHLKVDPGVHAVGAIGQGITLNFERKKSYYFLITSSNLERMDDIQGATRLTTSTEIPL